MLKRKSKFRLTNHAFFVLLCCRAYLIDVKEPRIILPRWTELEIDMMKAQLKDYQWIKDECPSDSSKLEKKYSIRKRRKRKRYIYDKNLYCKLCRRYFKNTSVLKAHKLICSNNKSDKQFSKLVDVEKKITTNNNNRRIQSSKDYDRYEIRPFLICKDCKRAFATTREIFKHRQFLNCTPISRDELTDLSDNTDNEYGYDCLYRCNVCRAKFISSQLLKNHRAQEKHWKTKKSGRKSRYKLIVVKQDVEDFTYRSVEENEYSCTICNNGIVYLDPDDLQKHHRSVHSCNEVYCRYCSHKLNDIAEFSDHHYAYHELLDFCLICNNGIDLSELLVGTIKPICLDCSWKLRTPAAAAATVAAYDDCLSLLKENLYCDDCERVMPSVAYVRFHNCSKEPRIISLSILACPLCLETFNGLRSLYRHIIKHNDVLSYRCNNCGRLHDTWKALTVHAKKCQNDFDLKLPKVNDLTLRRDAENVIKRFVRNGVTLLYSISQ